MKQHTSITMQYNIDQMRTRIASEQAAMHKVQLGVARWRGELGSNHNDRELAPPMAASQRAWHAAAQCHFLCWLADGGFAQALEESGVAEPLVLATQPVTSHQPAARPADTPALPDTCHNCPA